ncbi:unnamed protein product [Pleuronectes platessa]|uniref:Uncharacterized protein n=1 Tax=Pleuronectes platessa TaxID=8262 RepID=A0A9N7W128_PLEPL|nr:unnamed protein product [Pleuronectes platessa]
MLITASVCVCSARWLIAEKSRAAGQSLNAAETIHHHQRHLVTNPVSHSLVFPCILSALRWINQGEQPVLKPAGSVGPTEFSERLRETGTVSVLVTGSLYLVDHLTLPSWTSSLHFILAGSLQGTATT